MMPDRSEGGHRTEGDSPAAGGVRQLRHADRRPRRADPRGGTAARGSCRPESPRPVPAARQAAHGGGVHGRPRSSAAWGTIRAAAASPIAKRNRPTRSTRLCTVEVQGIIYIYNPPAGQNPGRRRARMMGKRRPHRPRRAAPVQPLAAQQRPPRQRSPPLAASGAGPPVPARGNGPRNPDKSTEWRSSMKSKKKFDPKVIQQFFIDHTEKFVIGLVAAFVSLLHLQLGHCSSTAYDKKPEELESGHQRGLRQDSKGPDTPRPAHVSALRPHDRPVQDAR